MNHQTPSPLERAQKSLLGLSLGDAFGQQFFAPASQVETQLASRTLPATPWYVTDDTLTALSILYVLTQHQCVHQDDLAQHLAALYTQHSDRGYGGTAHRILRHISQGIPWKDAAQEVFDGMGSMGNGAAMRAAPIGAYFAHDLAKTIEQTRLSAQVTHAHPDAQHGAIAVAIAAALITQLEKPHPNQGPELLHQIWRHTPAGNLRAHLGAAHSAGLLPHHSGPRSGKRHKAPGGRHSPSRPLVCGQTSGKLE